MRARSHAELDRIRLAVNRVRKLSDRVIGIGPFGLGLDAVLSWIPGVGLAYSLGAGGLLLVHARRAHAPPSTLAKMAAMLAADAVTDTVPVLGDVADVLFTGHKFAADALLKAMDETIYYEGGRAQAAADPDFQALMDRVRRGEDRRRVVFLDEG